MEKLFESTQGFALFLFFFVPGFVSLKVYDSLVASETRDFSKSIFDAVAYSALNYGILYPVIVWIRSGTLHWIAYSAAGLFVLIICPIVWPFLWLKVLSTKIFSSRFIHPVGRPWDFVFLRRKPCWVIVHLRDRRKIGGLFDRRSFASSHPAEPQLYLEEVWKLGDDGRFTERVKSTEGIIILEAEILAVEFFSYDD
jgi:Family of unknown function (DUF6338)